VSYSWLGRNNSEKFSDAESFRLASKSGLSDVDVIEQFIRRYRKEYDFYDEAARLAAQLLEQSLQSTGIRAIVTARAKSPDRLEQKVRQRNSDKHYQSVDDIYRDIVDLAGVRVALYFPGERGQVGKIATQLFSVEKVKTFPDASKPATYKKRFSGYWATHYRVRHRESSLNDAQKRYAEALIEIQVASVLMHAWAEVEHDLVYKPMQGSLSEDEYAILDELNGLVISGEIALERLQRAGENRVAVKDRVFSNQYDLATFLLNRAADILNKPDPEALLGRVSLLHQLLKAIGKATPDAIEPYLVSTTTDYERRPLADQIIDKILAESPKYYDSYTKLRLQESTERRALSAEGTQEAKRTHAAMGKFLTSWIALEQEIQKKAAAKIPNARLSPSFVLARQLQLFDQETTRQIERLRRFRNMLVHGNEIPSVADINDATRALDAILDELDWSRRSKSKPRKKR
jgi:ppGpp synthetase/RelA/SpoT-type nucleotidyltranferase